MRNVVAFCGSKGSGKSTSATIFNQLVTSNVEELAIAGHLKEACSRVWKLEMRLFLDPKFKEVELEDFIVLERRDVENLLRDFDVIPKDEFVRPHLGRVLRTPRALLQYIGTEVLHPIDPLIHVKKAMRKKDPAKITLITDLRFVAEFNYLKEKHDADFFPVYVKNPAAELAASMDSHASERQYIEFVTRCVVLNNEGSMESLKNGIAQLIKEL